MILAEPMPMMDAPHSMTSCARLQPGSGGHNHQNPLTTLSMPTTSRPLLKDTARCRVADSMTDTNKQKPDYPHRGDNCVKHHEQVANDGVAAGCQGFVTTSAKNGDQCWRDRSSRLVAAHSVLIGDESLCRYGGQRQTCTQCSGYDFHGNSGTEGDAGHQPGMRKRIADRTVSTAGG